MGGKERRHPASLQERLSGAGHARDRSAPPISRAWRMPARRVDVALHVHHLGRESVEIDSPISTLPRRTQSRSISDVSRVSGMNMYTSSEQAMPAVMYQKKPDSLPTLLNHSATYSTVPPATDWVSA
ncbi:hypothetical protein SAMN05216193_103189 [Pseudomonas jinjuensis]|uniref:Uncharacterized protein n=1 Tax=Pseudomonas jinjuensis TaxID=198616 RepID=A0A1H0BTF4_9PSED|nr:hypothetical protein SAMN05216193_103189 [Pseudomonas jinjuensis]